MKKARDSKVVEEVRERILEAALGVIVQEGFPALTMRRLASRIGMTAPNIYNYYQNKDELYITLVIRGFEMLHAALKAVCDRTADPRQCAADLARTYLAFGLQHSRYYDIMFTYPTPKYHDYVGTPLEKLSETEYHISMDIVQLALKATAAFVGPPADPADETVRMRFIAAWGMLHGMISLYNSKIVSYTTSDPNAMYEQLITEFLRLLAQS